MWANEETVRGFPFYPPDCLDNTWTAFQAHDFRLYFVVSLGFAFVNANHLKSETK